MAARDRRMLIYAVSLLLDCLALLVAYALSSIARDEQWLDISGHPIVLIALPVFIMVEIAREVQSIEAISSRSLGLSRALGALGVTALITILLTFLLKEKDVSRVGFGIFFAISAVNLIISKALTDGLVNLLLGGQPVAELLLLDGAHAKQTAGIDVIDVGKQGLWPDLTHPQTIDTLSRITAPYDRVVISCREEHREPWAKFLRSTDIGGEIIVDHAILQGAVAIGEFGGQDTLILSRGPLSIASLFQKRFCDVLLGCLLVAVLSPVMLAVALAIRLDSKGPVIFRQTRVGQGNRHFEMFKFRSMRQEDGDSQGNRSTSREDDRITKVGQFIRKTSIDELPQLFNVLRGDMSLVGPRPHALGSLAGSALFWEVTENYWLRHALKPGITGLAQVRGFRGATEREEDLEQRLRCDLEYAGNWSLWLDFIILLKTIRVVVHKNAY